MAKRIEVLDPRIKYPWAKWEDGQPWEAARGEDYEDAEVFRRIITSRASYRGWKAITRSRDGGECVQFQFYRKKPGDLLTKTTAGNGAARSG